MTGPAEAPTTTNRAHGRTTPEPRFGETPDRRRRFDGVEQSCFIDPFGSPNRPGMFGKYLVDQGLLREADLIDALDRQATQRVTIGRLAYQLGLMTLDQVVKVLDAQKKNPRRFVALAVELGFLTAEQLETLVESQRDARVPLGQIIASLGFVPPEKIAEALERYLAGKGS